MSMNISFESKGDFNNTRRWLKRIADDNPTVVMNQIANEGVKSLAANTPRDTGATASGWEAEVTKTGNVTEIAWKNRAHPETKVNIAKLIELGHGTGTGGYVPPKPYIKNAMKPVWQSADDKVTKELIK
jgi:hypothetical protein